MKILDKNYKIHFPKVIIFDWDNTLVDSWDLIHRSINESLIKYGKDTWSLAQTKINIHRSMRDTVSKLFPNNWEEVGEYYRKCYEEIIDDVKPLLGAEKSLQYALEKKIYSTVISNKKNTFLNIELNKLQWNKYFKSVIGSCDLPEDKPSKITVEASLKDCSIKHGSEVWFVGDSVTDMETAHNSNCVPVFFGDDDFESTRYSHCRPKIMFKNHQEFLKYLKIHF